MATKKEVNKWWRPLKFKTPQDFEDKAKEYFDTTPIDELTITGLALHLDTTRETLMDYQERDKFTDTIKRAKLRIENSYELWLRKNGRAWDIFWLKNFWWKDKSEVESSWSITNRITVWLPNEEE